MGGATAWVRRALGELGADATDVAVKAYIRKKEPTVPESQIGLALRKLRGRVVPIKFGNLSSKTEDRLGK
jgi:hypothetical protein